MVDIVVVVIDIAVVEVVVDTEVDIAEDRLVACV